MLVKMVPASKVSHLGEKEASLKEVFLKEVSVCLVDCMKMPAALRGPIKQEQLEDSLLYTDHLTHQEALVSQQEAPDLSAPKEEWEEEQISSTGSCAEDDGCWGEPPACSLTRIKIISVRTLCPEEQGSGVQETECSAEGIGCLLAGWRDAAADCAKREPVSDSGSVCDKSSLSTTAAASQNHDWVRSDHMDPAETRRDTSEGVRGYGMEEAPQEIPPAPEAGQDHEGRRRKRMKREERSPSVCDRRDEAAYSGETRGAPSEETSPSGGRAERNSTQDKEAHPGSSGVKTQLSLTSIFSCPECPYSFTAQTFLHEHIKRSHTDLYSKLLKSGEIRASSHLPSVASQPIRASGADQKTSNPKRTKSHCCDHCGKSYSRLDNLKVHQRVHTGEGLYHCNQCKKSFTLSRNLKGHRCVHTGERPYHCDQCKKCFSQLGELKVHQRVHTGAKPYLCDQCGKSYSQLSNLKSHQRVHTGERSYHCHQCGKSFGQPFALKCHQRVHTGERPYRCDQCGKDFGRPFSLKCHQRVHTGERPYRCDQCGKSFGLKRNLNSHRRVHTGERPYHCQQCGKGFSLSRNLKSHRRVHTGEKPHHCDQCGKSFSRLGHLKRHQRLHTGEMPYHCVQCGKSFSRLDGLKSHRCVHTDDSSD